MYLIIIVLSGPDVAGLRCDGGEWRLTMWLRKVRFSNNLLVTLILLVAIFSLTKFKTIYSQIDQGSCWKQI